LLEVIDEPAFRDEKYRTQPARLADKEFIDQRLGEILRTQSAEYWLTKLTEKRIPCARVNRLDEALADEQVLARNMVVELRHPEGGSTRGPGNPIKLSRTDEESFSPAPLLGQHTDSVLRDVLGYSDAQLAGLREKGAVA
ncbi:MAG: CoA transferase, partial [Congregibacter sp.]|nr:CoA transferase [Congregibacter sp.]